MAKMKDSCEARIAVRHGISRLREIIKMQERGIAEEEIFFELWRLANVDLKDLEDFREPS